MPPDKPQKKAGNSRGRTSVIVSAMCRLLSFTLTIFLLCFSTASIASDALLAAMKQGSHALLLRHALAPGFGDPPEFTIGDCRTQRNLSAEGRQQARDLGKTFRDAGLDDLLVFSSEWCRGRDTAMEMNLGTPVTHPGLNSFFQNRSKRDTIVRELRDLLDTLQGGPSAILVTHQVNVRAITGQSVASGRGVLIRLEPNGEHTIIGQL